MSDAIYWPCADVLILASQLAASQDLPPPGDLRQRVIDMLDRMVGAARGAGIADAVIAEARYALVAFIDEQILKSSWSGRGEWMNQPLQLGLYRENNAGENFFARMRALLNQGGRQVALQVYYLCLALGFRGAYGMTNNAPALASFTDAAQREVVQRLPAASKISPHALPRDRADAVLTSRAPLIGLLVGCALVVLVVMGALEWSLRSAIKDATQVLPTKALAAAPSSSAGH